MPVRARLLPWLRRSVLGAWFAMAYALGVLALALAPAPAAALAAPGGLLLCSGVPLPDEGGPGAPAQPFGDLAHCKGCPHNPVLAGPPALASLALARTERPVAPSPRLREDRPRLFATGLPPSRAPPAA
ncbi:hypothetical protein [Bosea minatitlanensis]|uniref:DUF2946 domain-containing protein n=1 Tax=Bosea minatitlanensis TaxID=128782 RepID=A0ABW0F7B8_9HYPH|nr:hypothetical protein [Bosea minatitlanensis]MCT4494780.1 hypothetical protein [Bosea minatitlanensis]